MFKEENNMKFKKFMALGLVAAMTATLFAEIGRASCRERV